ncbi:glycosyl hydrolase [Saccharicrinis sp. 156]|uniref:glycosyl hydrolase n=1 Tax=Saccharicrinis sp. 156 TaxID=3417574 RepID=UPI003D328E2B
MRLTTIFITLFLLIASNLLAQTVSCESVFYDSFSEDGALPAAWTEYNTNGQVTVVDGSLEFDYTASLPSAYRTFDAETQNLSISFDVSSTRNWAKCKLNIRSSFGQYITGLIIGNDGIKNIQYATALDASNNPTSYAGSLLDGVYSKNTIYSVSIVINFETKTLSFYQGDVIKAANVAFLEDATDVAKIDISQLSMYSNEGRFYFDNIELAYQGIDRSGLATVISEAQDAISEVILSPQYGYTKETYLALKESIEDATPLLTICEVTEVELAQAENDVLAAQAAFNASFMDEPVLTLYADSDFSGIEREYKCGYYNGNLGDFEDIPVSFKLDRGYMATFAQDADGKGFSKVYIAQDDDLEIIFPEELQHSISFMRISPWFEKQKKGSCGKGVDVQDALGSEWYYAWGMTNGYSTAEREFVPMSWSGGDGFSGLSATRAAGQNMAFNHHLGFNEPDLEDQSNMSVERALEVYPNLFASGLRLGSPAVSHGGLTWINEFMDSCVAKGYRVDFIAIHDYVRRSPKGYYDRYKALHDKYNVPIWVTEYNYGNPGMGSPVITDEVALAKLQSINNMMDTCSFIERYSMFYFQPSAGQLSIFETRTPIVFNIIGEYYKAHESPYPSYTQEVYEQGPNIGTGIETQLASDANISVFPNPVTNGIINLMFPKAAPKEFTLHLYDVSGNEVMLVHNKTQLDVANFKSGFYMLRIENAEINAVQKIMIRN